MEALGLYAESVFSSCCAQVRVGTVGGNTLGLYGAVFSPDGTAVLAHGYHGAFHVWRQQQVRLPFMIFQPQCREHGKVVRSKGVITVPSLWLCFLGPARL